MSDTTTPEFICTTDGCDLTTEVLNVAMAHAGNTGHTLTAALEEGNTVTVSLDQGGSLGDDDDEDYDNDWDDEL